MSSVNIDRYITTTQTVARVQRLNQAILHKDVLPVIGSSGSGKSAFLEWWWRGGCADPKFAGDYAITSDEILLINMLYPGPASAASIMLTGLEVALLELQRIQENGEKPRPLLQPKTLRTPAQVASLMRQVIQPLMDKLDPQALVVLNAHQLDTSALHYLIERYAPTRRSSVRRPERGLILCGNTQTPDKVNTPFKNVLQTAGFTRTALPEAMVYQPLTDKDEFAQIITRLIRQNLQAVPAEDMPWQEHALPAVGNVERTAPQMSDTASWWLYLACSPVVGQSNLIGMRQTLNVERTLPCNVERTTRQCGVNRAP